MPPTAPPPPPRAPGFDSTLSLLRDPYGFISRTARELQTEAFACRLLLKPAICLTGADAAELVYDRERFRRADAAPGFLLATLFGKGGVQGLDGQHHLHRKRLFLELTTPERVNAFIVEWATFASEHLSYRIDEEDRTFRANRVPAMYRDGLRIKDVGARSESPR